MAKEIICQLCTEATNYNGEWKWNAAGMAYLIRTKNNRLIAIDGGFKADVPHLLSKAQEMTGEERPTVAMWILTHPHLDHYGALLEMATNEEYRDIFNIEKLCYQITETPILPLRGISYEVDFNNVHTITEGLGVPVVTPHTDDVFDIDGMKIRFFFTPEDDADRLSDVNSMSMVFRIKGTNKSVMFPGDAHHHSTSIVCFKYWNELKSDICQVSHHGLTGAAECFYAKVAAETLLTPISPAGDRFIQGLGAGHVGALFASKLAEREIKAYEGDTYLDL